MIPLLNNRDYKFKIFLNDFKVACKLLSSISIEEYSLPELIKYLSLFYNISDLKSLDDEDKFSFLEKIIALKVCKSSFLMSGFEISIAQLMNILLHLQKIFKKYNYTINTDVLLKINNNFRNLKEVYTISEYSALISYSELNTKTIENLFFNKNYYMIDNILNYIIDSNFKLNNSEKLTFNNMVKHGNDIKLLYGNSKNSYKLRYIKFALKFNKDILNYSNIDKLEKDLESYKLDSIVEEYCRYTISLFKHTFIQKGK
jgi:hypothetical protein